MNVLRAVLGRLDRWQRRHKPASVTYGVVRKFSDDNANLLVVSLAWYGFTAIFPLLLVVVTVLGFIGVHSLGDTVVSTLHHFPVVGDSFNPSHGGQLHGSPFGLVIGVLGALYGAQGVTQVAQQAMSSVWDVPQVDRPGFLPRLGRSLGGLVIIGAAFLINAAITGYVTRAGETYAIRIPVLIGLLILNIAFYWASFIVLSGNAASARTLLPGAIAGAVGFTALITVGTGLVNHELKNASTTYGAFGSVIGIVAFLLLLAKISLYAAELNVVLKRRLYPRALPMGEMTDADREVDRGLIHEQRRTKDEEIGVTFTNDPEDRSARRPA